MKKFPSIVKTSNHNRFNFEPRYYDPIKEEIEDKIRSAKSASKDSDIAAENSNISKAFQRRAQKNHKSNVMQLIIAVILMGTFVAWIFYGNVVLYAYLFLSPAYFYFRVKKKTTVLKRELDLKKKS